LLFDHVIHAGSVKNIQLKSIEARRYINRNERPKHVRIDHNSTVTQFTVEKENQAIIDFKKNDLISYRARNNSDRTCYVNFVNLTPQGEFIIHDKSKINPSEDYIFKSGIQLMDEGMFDTYFWLITESPINDAVFPSALTRGGPPDWESANPVELLLGSIFKAGQSRRLKPDDLATRRIFIQINAD